MKKLLLVLVVLLLSGCETTIEQDMYNNLPEGLSDCSFYTIRENVSYIRIVRCPNSDTTVNYKQGKSRRTTTTIDK